MLLRKAIGVVLSCLVLLLPLVSARGQSPDYVLSMGNIAGANGSAASAQVQLDNLGSVNLKGWSYGVCTTPGLVSVSTLISGATTATVKTGGPPDFESFNTFANGFTHGVVVCFSGCSILPPGLDYHLATANYTITGAAGAAGTGCFCDTLGAPIIETIVVDPLGTAIVPTQVCGAISITPMPPAVIGITCTPVLQACSCDALVTWTNAGTYDSISVFRDGLFVVSLPGTATSYTSVGELGLHTFCVQPVRLTVAGEQRCCNANCPDVSVPATAVSGLTCDVDPDTCTATVSWTNSSQYSALTVLLNGTLISTLAGTAESASVPIAGAALEQICIGGTTICADPIPQACCSVQCASGFQRADSNGDGALNIADPIALLDLLFSGGAGAVNCDDALDGNDDGNRDIADAVFVLAFLFSGGPTPPAPFGVCGVDPTTDALGCVSHPVCP